MKERDIEELKQPEEWGWDSAEVKQPLKGRRSVLSVAFRSKDFQRVTRCAERLKMPVSTFVRLAALEKVQWEDSFAPLTWSAGNQAQVVIEELTPFVSSSVTMVREQRPEYDPVTS